MKDRVSTKILNNGATRYGVYDETGKLLRYEYIKLEDEPSTEGDFFNKANMLPDSIPRLLGLKMENPQVADALNVLANVGNLHVWERVQDGVTDYLTSTDRNAYPDQSAEGGEPEKPAHYTLYEAETVDVLSSSADYIATLYSCDLDSVLVNNDGSISTTNFSVSRGGSNIFTSAGSWASFSPTEAHYITSGSDNVVFTDTIFTVSEETTLTYSGGKYILQGCRKLIGHAKVEAIPANTTITYLGQLGGAARIEVGSYVGTGTYGSSNPNSLTFGFEPKMVLIFTEKTYSFSPYGFCCDDKYFNVVISSQSTDTGVSNKLRWDGKNVAWYAESYYGGGSANLPTYGVSGQLNTSGKTYNYIAIG